MRLITGSKLESTSEPCLKATAGPAGCITLLTIGRIIKREVLWGYGEKFSVALSFLDLQQCE